MMRVVVEDHDDVLCQPLWPPHPHNKRLMMMMLRVVFEDDGHDNLDVL